MGIESQFWVKQRDPSPFFLEGGAIGVLLLHGFGGTAREMQPLGDDLHGRGLTVSAPLLPGHGGTLAEINRARWQDWTEVVETAHTQLRAHCDVCVVAGFSMGSLLALWLAENVAGLSGVVLYSPAVKLVDSRLRLTPLFRRLVKSVPKPEGSDLQNPDAEVWLGGYDRYPVPAAAQLWFLQRNVVHNLSRVRVPVLVVYSEGDRDIHADAGSMVVRRLADAVPVEVMRLRDSGHAVVVDQDWESVAETTYRFIQQYTHAQ